VSVSDGDKVSKGQALLVIEAMKMEHTIAAPADGVVSDLVVREGLQVAVDAPLVSVTPETAASETTAEEPR
jgi:acetyl-CoA/propionyl-CoA carboxylase biotin carboxyl carrier protein